MPTLSVSEHPIYCSSRLGVSRDNIELSHLGSSNPLVLAKTLHITPLASPGLFQYIRCKKLYELSNHLGNVMVTISDRKTPVYNGNQVDYYEPTVLSYCDYYPFGMQMPGRNDNSGEYRFGFNGQEKDDEIKGEGNSLAFEYRIHDPRVGRFLSVDPQTAAYPWYTPYQYAGNSPVFAIDLEGAQPVSYYFVIAKIWFEGWKSKMQNATSDIVQATTKTAPYNNPHVPHDVQRMLNIQQFAQGTQTLYNGISDVGHVAMDLFGSVPVVGEIIDGLNGCWYAAEGQYAYAGISFASAIGIGEVFKYGKYLFKYGDNAAGALFKLMPKYSEELKNVDVLVDKVRFFDQGDPKKVIVIGRGQTERINKVANAIGAETFSIKGIPVDKQLSENISWIRKKLKEGYSVLDLGLDPKYTATQNYKYGDYYKAELQETMEHFKDKIK